MYYKAVMPHEMDGYWHCMFSEGRQNVEDDGQNEHPSTSTSNKNTARVAPMLRTAPAHHVYYTEKCLQGGFKET
ncbi:hypothetical protein TNCV_3796581 [Trichonephila clavipes]|nr:hypothetical protein TNCV_3796581 [Trichonephila clavipes]